MPAPGVTPPPPSPAQPQGRRWQRDPWGWALLGSGAAATVAGGVVLGLGMSAARDTRSVALQSEHREATLAAGRLQPAGIATIVVGSAIWVAGAVRMAIVDRRSSSSTAYLQGPGGFSIEF